MSAPDDLDRAVLADPATTTGGDAVPASNPAATPAAAWRYTLGGEIGHGGMGVVYRATDTTFGREVAVKVLHEKFGPDSGAARRFADEARITGQLQHPAIPPVHDQGTLPDGRPFLAMKLIRGQTLAELLAQRPDLDHQRGRFVAAFEQVAQAVAYAHDHRVLHRDLKPANVMVGNYGEVQVMDWGQQPVSAKECLELAQLSVHRKLHAAAARFWTRAFLADAKRADDLRAAHRYDAACSAALAAAGVGEDATKLDDTERSRLRQQAHDWLRADLALWKKQTASANVAERKTAADTLAHWLADRDLSGVREAKSLAKLPAAERQHWQALWADVKATLGQAQKPAAPPDRLAPPRVEK